MRGQEAGGTESAELVGRERELRLFDERWHGDPESGARRTMFHLHGVAGVGKSSLLRRFAAAARERDALTAVLDESATGVPEALAGICAQFAARGAPLKALERLLETYRQRRYEAEAAVLQPDPGTAAPPEAPGGPQPSPGLVTAAQIGVVGLGTVLPVAGILDPVRLASNAGELRSVLSRRFGRPEDVQLLLDPPGALSPVLVAELTRVAARGRRIALFFDTYERTGPFLDPWLRGLVAEERYGPLPDGTVITTSGQRAPDPAVWADHAGLVTGVPLSPFTEAESRLLLTAKRVVDEDVVRDVLRLSGGLPVLVSMLAENAGRPDGLPDPSATAVERFLRGETDPDRRGAALRGALPRRLNEDILLVATGRDPDGPDADPTDAAGAFPGGGPGGPEPAGDPSAAGLFDWLGRQPFVSHRDGHARYHDVVRDPMLRLQRTRSPRRWRAAHTRLADAFAAWAAEETDGEAPGGPREGLRDIHDSGPEEGLWAVDAWRTARIEETYHRLCARPRTALPAALRDGVLAAGESVTSARRWAGAVADAGADTDDAALRELGAHCLAAVEDESRLAVPLIGVILGRAETDDTTRRRALLVRADDHRGLGHHDEALADYRLAIALGDDSPRTRHELGETYRVGGRYEEALTEYALVLARCPDTIPTIASAAYAHYKLGRHDEALTGFDRAVAARPRYTWALRMRAEVRNALGDGEGALADVTAAHDIAPRVPWVVGARAEQLRRLGRHDEALTHFDRAIELDPDYAWAHGSRAMSHHALGGAARALADLDRALTLDPGYAWALLRRAELHHEQGDAGAALADLDRTLDISPRYVGALLLRAEIHRERGDTDTALADLDRAVATGHAEAASLVRRARLHLDRDDPAGALGDVRRLVALGDTAGARAVLADPALDAIPEARALVHGLTGADGGSGA
ncbi:tetratricopeptide repeat protein [Streptomyces sp. NPDC006798]|uniref:tetratricopeptide repeat protein n=1 Tax=Streptomyces sp. NPDC006798 TaxID=3155462 RepID=UPI0033DF1ECC